MQKIKAAVMHGIDDVRIDEVDFPQMKAGEVLIKMNRSAYAVPMSIIINTAK